MSTFKNLNGVKRPNLSLRRHRKVLAGFALMLLSCAVSQASLAQEVTFDLDKATILDIQKAFEAGALDSERLVQMYLNRIATYDDHGPALNAIITVNPQALETARALDAERAEKGPRSPLHGIPVLLKDNYNTFDMPTTGGSVTLAGSIPPDDAFTVKQLRAMGAIILGKANLSEFALGAGRGAYSSINGVTKNPYRLESDPGASSGGPAASVAADFATLAFGSDTGGSIRGPAAATGVVGIRPSGGLISRAGIIPQALTLDTAGPLARNVTDAAIAIGILEGVDPNDPTTAKSEELGQDDYTQFLVKDAFKGARIGVVRNFFGGDPEVDELVNAAIAEMEAQGAVIVEVSMDPEFLSSLDSLRGMINSEFQPYLEDYLATLADGYPKTLEEIIAISESPEVVNSPRPVNPGIIESHKKNLAIGGLDNPDYIRVIGTVLPQVRSTMEALIETHKVDALVWPTSRCTAAPRYTLKDPERVCVAGPNPTLIATYTGFPDIQVPVGYSPRGLPSTISFVGPAYSEPSLIGFAYAYEQATMHRRAPKLFPALPGEVFEYDASGTKAADGL